MKIIVNGILHYVNNIHVIQINSTGTLQGITKWDHEFTVIRCSLIGNIEFSVD